MIETMAGEKFRDHTITVPVDRADPTLGTMEVYAREIASDDSLPFLLFLQGGPGNAAPRPLEIDGWIKAALRHYRVLLFDQRGTGRSGRIDRFADPSLIDARRLSLLRSTEIVADAEDLRRALGVKTWDVLGQSFGGFCITTYLSTHPESIGKAYFTGGLPATGVGIDDVHRATYAKLARRHEQFYAEVPYAESTIRQICAHLDDNDERLPTGERLTSRRFRTIGVELGRGAGFAALASLLEEPFHEVGGQRRLRGDTLAELSTRLSFETTPLYAVIHESIYGGVAEGATNWSAHRIREEIAGFEENRSPTDPGPFYLTGEHIYPWQFDEDPALRPFKQVAEELAAKQEWAAPYDVAALKASNARGAAVVYTDDIFVPRELSLDTAGHLPGIAVWGTGEYQHDGLRRDGEQIFDRLMGLAAR